MNLNTDLASHYNDQIKQSRESRERLRRQKGKNVVRPYYFSDNENDEYDNEDSENEYENDEQENTNTNDIGYMNYNLFGSIGNYLSKKTPLKGILKNKNEDEQRLYPSYYGSDQEAQNIKPVMPLLSGVRVMLL